MKIYTLKSLWNTMINVSNNRREVNERFNITTSNYIRKSIMFYIDKEAVYHNVVQCRSKTLNFRPSCLKSTDN